MKDDVPSRTAQGTALIRAAHQILDRPRVFEDPLAVPIIGREIASALASGPREPLRLGSRHLRAFVAVRSRYAEDELAAAVQRGVRQYVVLGAGLDTFAYRNPYSASGLRVFEVDHPSTQTWKKKRLELAGIVIPASLTFVAVDFEQQLLSERLKESGLDSGAAAFFAWLGVTPYLTREAALATLSLVASMPAGSGVVFDYVVPRCSLASRQQSGRDALVDRVERAGEPFRLFFEPEELAGLLKNAGFRDIEDLGPQEIYARYFADRADGLGAAGSAHLVSARVTPAGNSGRA